MKKTLLFISILLIGLAFGCGNQGSNELQQPQFGPGGGGGFGGPGNINPEEMAQRQIERLSEQLNLSEDQEKQIYDLTIENYENLQELRNQMGDGGDFEAMREQMQKSREEQDNKIKSVLTSEQWEKYQAYQEEMNSRRGQGGPGGGFRGPR